MDLRPITPVLDVFIFMPQIFLWVHWLQPLGMKKIEAEKALVEAVKGCNLKRGGQCHIVQVHVRLLSVILYETDEP